ncbi:hypothetical protein [Frankia sp. CcWB2]
MEEAEAGGDGLFPGLDDRRGGEDLLGGVMVLTSVVGEDRGLAAVEETSPEAFVAVKVVEGFGPAAGAGQGACSVGEQDGPQPADDLGMVSGGDEVVEREGSAIESGLGFRCDGAVERGEEAVGAETVTGA